MIDYDDPTHYPPCYTVATVECPHANSMGVAETEDCGAKIECAYEDGGWTIPSQCDRCGYLLGGDVNMRALLVAQCEDAT